LLPRALDKKLTIRFRFGRNECVFAPQHNDMWQRFAAIGLVVVILLGAAPSSATKGAQNFSILGASVDVNVVRDGVTLPATLVPSLASGDKVEISFPKGVQYSRNPRWHMIVAILYEDYLQHAPTFPIADADLSHAAAGHVWSFTYEGTGTALIFLVPEDGSRRGHGMPDARSAIDDLQNRSLLLRTAVLSSTAAAKASTMDEFLRSLASIEPGELPDGRARVAAATQSLFGYDLGSQACFTTGTAQSTQYACAAQAVAQGYDATPSVNPIAAIGTQLSVNTATYGMLIGAIYTMLARRHVSAHYTFIPGVIKPGSKNTNVYVDQTPSYDATAEKPSTIVYVALGSAAGTKQPSYGPAPSLPECVSDSKLDLAMPFNGLPVYFHGQTVDVHSKSASFQLPATYDPLRGYSATLDAQQSAAVTAGGASASVTSQWGFSEIDSPARALIAPHPATWTLRGSAPLISGSNAASLTLDDGTAGMGPCVASVDVTDGLGHALTVKKIDRSNDSVTVTIDASNATGPNGTVSVVESAEPAASPVSFTLLPAMPQITSAIAYLPHGTLVLHGSGLKYIDTVQLERTGITFANGTPNQDGSWTFSAHAPAPYQAQWEHETMAISYTLVAPDTRTAAVPADVQYQP
jgi:hypothetical protein